MPPRSMLDESEYRCPSCGSTETYVHKVNDNFLCSNCDFSAAIEEVADR